MALSDWNPRLLTPERALLLAGDWPLYVDAQLAELSQFEPESGGGVAQGDQLQANLRCGAAHFLDGEPETETRSALCGQSVGLLTHITDPAAPAAVVRTSLSDLLSAVIRHMVVAHNLSLSGGGSNGHRDGRDRTAGPAGPAHADGRVPGNVRGGDPAPDRLLP